MGLAKLRESFEMVRVRSSLLSSDQPHSGIDLGVLDRDRIVVGHVQAEHARGPVDYAWEP